MAAARRLMPGVGGPGFEVVELAAGTVERYRMLDGGETVLVAVSGGPDSMCLLDVLRRLAPTFELTLHVAHVDHGLQAGSEEIAARLTHELADGAVEVHLIRAPDLAGPNLHARARAFRYSFFQTIAESVGATRIATGHTLDDRVETTLARLVHGAPTEGLAGIPPFDEPRMRPLIGVRRGQTRSYCEQRSLHLHHDPANEDPRFERVVVRHKLLAAIEEHWGDGGVRAIASSSEHLREDASLLAGLAQTLFGQLARTEGGTIVLAREDLIPVGRALRRRLLELAVGRVRDRSGGIEAALDALEGDPQPGSRFAVASGIEIVIDQQHLSVRTDRVAPSPHPAREDADGQH